MACSSYRWKSLRKFWNYWWGREVSKHTQALGGPWWILHFILLPTESKAAWPPCSGAVISRKVHWNWCLDVNRILGSQALCLQQGSKFYFRYPDSCHPVWSRRSNSKKDAERKGYRSGTSRYRSQGISQCSHLYPLAALLPCSLASWRAGGEERHFNDPLVGD